MRTKHLLRSLAAAFSLSLLPLGLPLTTKAEPTQPPAIAQATRQNLTTCESSGNKRQRCSMDTRNGVVLVEQLSHTSCEGKWNYGEGYVEVRNGCRAKFAQGNQGNSNSSNSGLLKARAAYDTILVDQDANVVIGVSQGQLIYVNCSDITRIEGDKRVFAMDTAGNKGYILTNAVDGASCDW